MQKITADSPESKSPDLVAENIAKLKELFPELLTEGENGSSVNLDVLKSLVGDQTVTDVEEKYGFNWHGKRKARQLAINPSTGTLRPCPEDSVDWDTTQNLMIEGDNLEVLKLLQKSYAGKVNFIYIDPPYNTGKDFVYPDNFKDNIKNYLELTGQTGEGGNKLSSNPETSGRFHTDWLNMMYPRLKLARNLLSDDGVIFISIDDSEELRLRALCDEIFGEENRLDRGCLIWKSACSPRGFRHIVKDHEYILAYSKNLDSVDYEFTTDPDKLFDGQLWIARTPANPVAQITFPAGLRCEGIDRVATGQIGSGKTIIDIVGELVVRNGKLAKQVTLEASWPSKNQLIEFLSKIGSGEKTFDTKDQEWHEVFFNGTNFPLVRKVRGRVSIRSIIDDAGNTGTPDLKDLGLEFPHPKPLALIAKLLNQFSTKDSLVLDFFAGSGTVAHATLALNSQDCGTRRYVAIQLPEPAEEKQYKAITEITKERLRLAGTKIRKENPMFSGDTGFRVFKLDSTNIREWDPNRENLAESLEASVDHLKSNRTEQDILFELLLKLGLDLCVPMVQRTIAGKTVYSIGAGVLITCLDKSISRADAEPLALGILAWLKELNTAGDSTLVFRDSAFADDVAKTNLSKILEQNGIAAKNIRSL